jgi:hypothetical protein
MAHVLATRKLFGDRNSRARILTVVDIATAPRFAVGKSRVLLDAMSDAFDISPNGERFLFLRRTDDRPLTQVNLVENWSQELTCIR